MPPFQFSRVGVLPKSSDPAVTVPPATLNTEPLPTFSALFTTRLFPVPIAGVDPSGPSAVIVNPAPPVTVSVPPVQLNRAGLPLVSRLCTVSRPLGKLNAVPAESQIRSGPVTLIRALPDRFTVPAPPAIVEPPTFIDDPIVIVLNDPTFSSPLEPANCATLTVPVTLVDADALWLNVAPPLSASTIEFMLSVPPVSTYCPTPGRLAPSVSPPAIVCVPPLCVNVPAPEVPIASWLLLINVPVKSWYVPAPLENPTVRLPVLNVPLLCVKIPSPLPPTVVAPATVRLLDAPLI